MIGKSVAVRNDTQISKIHMYKKKEETQNRDNTHIERQKKRETQTNKLNLRTCMQKRLYQPLYI